MRVCAGTLTRTFRPWYSTVVQCAGMRTRMCFFKHRSALTTRENATVATDGSRMLSVQFCTGDVARTPLGVKALLRAKQLAWCTPTPCTASCVLDPELN